MASRPLLAVVLSLGAALGAKDPALLAAVRVEGEDPAILHLIGQGFQAPRNLISLLVNGSVCQPIRVINDAHLITLRPEPRARGLVSLVLMVRTRASRPFLFRSPLTLAAAPGASLGQEAGAAPDSALHRALGAAFPAPEDPDPRAEVMVLDPEKGEVAIAGGAPIPVGSRGVKFLATLAALPGKAASGVDLARVLFGGDGLKELMGVRGEAQNVRNRIEKDPEHPTRLVGFLRPGQPVHARGTQGYRLALWDASPGARNLPPATMPAAGNLQFSAEKGRISLNGREVTPTDQGYRLLRILDEQPGKGASMDWLVQHPPFAVLPDPRKGLKNTVRTLRKQLEADPRRPQFLLTDPNADGKGYSGYRLHVR